MAKFTARTYVSDFGWTVDSFTLTHAPVGAEEVRVTVESPIKPGVETCVPVLSVEAEGGNINITTQPFSYQNKWTVTVGKDSYTRKDVDDEQVRDLDRFAPITEGEVIYRLYSPMHTAPRPLILFLHGGGECGYDNLIQLTGTVGAIKLSHDYPDMYVMAPQAPTDKTFVNTVGMMRAAFKDSNTTSKRGWNREYLAAVCDIIRRMIAEGKVDERRVYVTGLSMGGYGTLRAMSVGAGLFAAAAPICPTMTPESFNILRGMTDGKIWISTAYVDHTVYRHKYITDGIAALRDGGNKNARVTIYSPEELAAYGIGTDPDFDYKQLFADNHSSWILTYHDEYGIMSWLTQQVKD